MGLPPFLPRAAMKGTPESMSASFDSAAETNPTGTPTTSAGRAAPSRTRRTTSSRAVGALPTATTEPCSKPSACALRTDSMARVELAARARSTTSWSEMNEWTRQPYAASRSSFRPAAIIFTSTMTGQPRESAATPDVTASGENAMRRLNSKSAVACITRRTTCHSAGGKSCGPVSASMMEKLLSSMPRPRGVICRMSLMDPPVREWVRAVNGRELLRRSRPALRELEARRSARRSARGARRPAHRSRW